MESISSQPAPFPQRHIAQSDRLLVVLSDLELGAGGPMDDLPQSDCIGTLLSQYNTSTYTNQQVEVIFNGDTFDFLKISVDGCYPIHISAAIAHAKLEQVAAAHQGFLSGLRQFLAHHPDRKLHFLVGNHDPELLFPSIQEAIKGLVGHPDQIHFHDLEMQTGDVHIEHGHQKVGMFRIDPKEPFISHKGESILKLPWGNVALLDAIIPLKSLFYQYDRIKPKSQLFALVPELKTLMNRVYWRYWMRDFWKRGEPLKKLSWKMSKELLRSMLFVGPDTILSPMLYRKALLRSPAHRLFLIGHEHEAGWWSSCGQKLLYTGAFRNEYLLQTNADGTPGLQLQPKIYAEVWMQDDHTICSHLIETNGPEPPPDYQPDSILTAPPTFLEKLAQLPRPPAKEDK